MNIQYNEKTDLLYLRLADNKQDVVNKRISENIVLDMSEDEKIVGIEILDASRYIDLDKLMPVHYELV
ncbi:MAG: DUF2283 domain-containing protein [Spirochaetota bacterium]|nr:DUF2283 domain-containing protein [Spirochaetota bacterium]